MSIYLYLRYSRHKWSNINITLKGQVVKPLKYNNNIIYTTKYNLFTQKRYYSINNEKKKNINNIQDQLYKTLQPLDYSYPWIPRTILLIKKVNSIESTKHANNIVKWLQEHNIQVFIEPNSSLDFDNKLPNIFDIIYNTQDKDIFIQELHDTFPTLKNYKFFDVSIDIDSNGDIKKPCTIPNDIWKNYWNTQSYEDRNEEDLKDLGCVECAKFIRKYTHWVNYIDTCITIGGDGTLLYLNSIFRSNVPPTLSFGSGSFGFLMPFNPNSYSSILKKLIHSEQRIFLRPRLSFKIEATEAYPNDGHPVVSSFQDTDQDNDVVLKHIHEVNASYGVSEIECHINGEQLAYFQGDGVIISSSTGSTAYSMSAGGSIVHPSIPCLLLTPICPMTLASKPIIVPPQCTIAMRPLYGRILLEGRFGRLLKPNELVTVRQSKHSLPTFLRKNAISDFVGDLVQRMNYARIVRIHRDDCTEDDYSQLNLDASYISKRMKNLSIDDTLSTKDTSS